MGLSIVILAAGKGKRMHSQLPKVLHPLAGKPLLEHVVQTAAALSAATPLIVYGHQGDVLRHSLAHLNAIWVEQQQQLGTGHAVAQALKHIPEEDQVLILYGDVPLIGLNTLQNLIQQTPADALGIITAQLPNPFGFGRILRDKNGAIIRIIEEKDADTDQQKIAEINSGIYLVPAKHLHTWLPKLNNQNAQQEYYLTDIIPLAATNNIAIYALQPAHYQEILGINDRIQLAQLERFYQQQQAEKWMKQGVTILDPNRFDVRGEVTISEDVTIDINVILEGKVHIGAGCTIGANCILRNTSLADGIEIRPNSIIDGAVIAADSSIGPFARLRPGTQLAEGTHIGNFVEIKNSLVGAGTKINHLTYVGDSEIGKQTNIGAGTITCNYDGANKHKTIIGDHAFIGSNTSLVAPITIGDYATIGAGSTITRNAPAYQLTICRAPQRTIENWQRPKKNTQES